MVTGVAFLPFSVGSALASNLSTIVLMPRVGPLVVSGMLAAAGGAVWLAQHRPAPLVRRDAVMPDFASQPYLVLAIYA